MSPTGATSRSSIPSARASRCTSKHVTIYGSLAGRRRAFASGERIHTENSYKYTPDTLRQMLKRAGYAWVALYTDDAGGFAVALAGA